MLPRGIDKYPWVCYIIIRRGPIGPHPRTTKTVYHESQARHKSSVWTGKKGGGIRKNIQSCLLSGSHSSCCIDSNINPRINVASGNPLYAAYASHCALSSRRNCICTIDVFPCLYRLFAARCAFVSGMLSTPFTPLLA